MRPRPSPGRLQSSDQSERKLHDNLAVLHRESRAMLDQEGARTIGMYGLGGSREGARGGEGERSRR